MRFVLRGQPLGFVVRRWRLALVRASHASIPNDSRRAFVASEQPKDISACSEYYPLHAG
jgi:hypothetical protein